MLQKVQIVLVALIPIINILFFGWDWQYVTVLYWLSSITFALMTAITIFRGKIGVRFSSYLPTLFAETLIATMIVFIYAAFTLVSYNIIFETIFPMVDGSMAAVDLSSVLWWWGAGVAIRVIVSMFQPIQSNLHALLLTPVIRMAIIDIALIVCITIIVGFHLPKIAAVVSVFICSGVEFYNANRKEHSSLRASSETSSA